MRSRSVDIALQQKLQESRPLESGLDPDDDKFLESLIFQKLKQAVQVIQILLHRQHQMKIKLSSDAIDKLDKLKNKFIQLRLKATDNEIGRRRSNTTSIYNIE